MVPSSPSGSQCTCWPMANVVLGIFLLRSMSGLLFCGRRPRCRLLVALLPRIPPADAFGSWPAVGAADAALEVGQGVDPIGERLLGLLAGREVCRGSLARDARLSPLRVGVQVAAGAAAVSGVGAVAQL